MFLRRRGESYEWRCRVSKSRDCSVKSVKAGSFFTRSALLLRKAMLLILMWNEKFTSSQIASQLKISNNTVMDWRNFLRDLCIRIEDGYPKIGGNGQIVEIDESALHGRKYGRGTKDKEIDWVFGGYEQGSGHFFAQLVPNRTAKTLTAVLRKHVDMRSTIYSDSWKGYSKLNRVFASHMQVNHSVQFVNIVNGVAVHTNSIESFWRRMKQPLKINNGTSDVLLASYITETVVRENEGDFLAAIFREIVSFKT